MTAVFKKPLSKIRKPLSVSFSSLSPTALGAATLLNAVAGMLLSVILQIPHGLEFQFFYKEKTTMETYGTLYVFPVRLSTMDRAFLSARESAGFPMGQSLGLKASTG